LHAKAKIAKSIGCTISTLERLIEKTTVPTDEMLRQTEVLINLGFRKYSKLSRAEKEKISETIGSVSGGGVGFASISVVVSSLGTPGLSASGIASGLSTLGGVVGGGMTAGIAVVAVVPVAGLFAGFGVVKGAKYFVSEYRVGKESVDKKWEYYEK
jgi:hypothetical protein